MPGEGDVSAPHDHQVLFYNRETDLAAAVARHLGEGLVAGQPALVVTDRAHRTEIEDLLAGQGIDVAEAAGEGRYQALDAADTLDTLMIDGRPDAARFWDTIAALQTPAQAAGPTRVFGEMVTLLWDDGNAAGALALEALWNHPAARDRFSLLCAYPIAGLHRQGDLRSIADICRAHSSWQPPDYSWPSQAPPEAASELFLPVPSAVGAVRRFVTWCLASWDRDRILPDAVLVASELATNAVLHARSPFRVGVLRSGRVVRISVEDGGAEDPALRQPHLDGVGGRGVAIVSQLSHRWGHQRFEASKVVWSELEPA